MLITFTRSDCGYRTTICRDDGVIFRVPAFDCTHSLPHDMAHYFVENRLGLKRGFWGCIAAGAVYPGMERLSGRLRPHSADRSRELLRASAQQNTEAEVLVSALLRITHERLDDHWPAARTRLHHEWRPRVPSRALPDEMEVRQICAALREAEHSWQSLAVGESVRVIWPEPGKQRKDGRRRPRKGARLLTVPGAP